MRAIAGSLGGLTEESLPAEMRADLIADFRGSATAEPVRNACRSRISR